MDWRSKFRWTDLSGVSFHMDWRRVPGLNCLVNRGRMVETALSHERAPPRARWNRRFPGGDADRPRGGPGDWRAGRERIRNLARGVPADPQRGESRADEGVRNGLQLLRRGRPRFQPRELLGDAVPTHLQASAGWRGRPDPGAHAFERLRGGRGGWPGVPHGSDAGHRAGLGARLRDARRGQRANQCRHPAGAPRGPRPPLREAAGDRVVARFAAGPDGGPRPEGNLGIPPNCQPSRWPSAFSVSSTACWIQPESPPRPPCRGPAAPPR